MCVGNLSTLFPKLQFCKPTNLKLTFSSPTCDTLKSNFFFLYFNFCNKYIFNFMRGRVHFINLKNIYGLKMIFSFYYNSMVMPNVRVSTQIVKIKIF